MFIKILAIFQNVFGYFLFQVLATLGVIQIHTLCALGMIYKNFNSLLYKLKSASKNKFIRHGLPFILLIFGGTIYLKQFSSIRYEFTQIKSISTREAEKLGIHMKKPEEVTLESEFKKIENLDIDNWEQVRGPRPWEENIK